MEIIINGRKQNFPDKQKKSTYREIVLRQFARNSFNDSDDKMFDNPNRGFTVTYSKGIDGNSGSLTDGDSVKLINGMVFNVTATDRA
jgi:hypothetical protein